MHRREALKQIGAVAGSVAALGIPFLPYEKQYLRPKIMGTTYSQRQWDALRQADPSLEMTWDQAYEEILNEGYDIIRLGSYMDEFEVDGNKRLKHMMDRAREKRQKVRLVVGVRQPRVPEIWASHKIDNRLNLKDKPGQIIGSDKQTFNEILQFVEEVVLQYRDYANLVEFQVENEPLASFHFARYHVVYDKLFGAEVDLVDILRRKQLICATSEFGFGEEKSFELAVANPKIHKIGLDVYPKIPKPGGGYWIPNGSFWHNLELRKRQGEDRGKIVYIAEAQAEGWINEQSVDTKEPDKGGVNPLESLRLMERLTDMGFEEIDAWGAEYWKYQREIGNSQWHDLMVEGYALRKAA